MYHNISPATLYKEYETRVTKAAQNRQRVVDAQLVARPVGAGWTRFRARLLALRDSLERQLQPAEAGYIA